MAELPLPRASERDRDRRGVRAVPRDPRARATARSGLATRHRVRGPFRVYSAHAERGDESAVLAASSLEREADAAATRHGGRLIKLLGDGAMLRLADAAVGVWAAFELVETMSGEGVVSSHAGVHAGPVIERDLDVFGQTVNIASRIADAAGPGEVLASEAVAEAAGDGGFAFERLGRRTSRASRPGSALPRHTEGGSMTN